MNSILSLLKVAVAAGGLFAILSLTSCNTVAGFGRDLESTGQALENAAN